MNDKDRFRGTIIDTDILGNPHTYYYFYDNEDRVRAIRSLLYEYVYRKYLDQLVSVIDENVEYCENYEERINEEYGLIVIP